MITENDLAPGAYKSIAQALYEQFEAGEDWRGRVVVAVDTLDGGTAYVEVYASLLLWWSAVYMPDGSLHRLRGIVALRWETNLAGSRADFPVSWEKVADELYKL